MVNTPTPAAEFSEKLSDLGVRCMPVAKYRLRFVFHREIEDEQLEHAINMIASLSKEVHETSHR
jgi:hypothetical protein